MREPAIRISKHWERKPMSRAARQFLRLAFILPAGICLALPAQTQQQSGTMTGRLTEQQTTQGVDPTPSADSPFQQRRLRALNAERQKELVSDTNKLLKLTAELNNEVNHNKSDSFTPDQLRQLAKIEKLARSVKDKMCNPVQTSIFGDDFPPPAAIAPMGIP